MAGHHRHAGGHRLDEHPPERLLTRGQHGDGTQPQQRRHGYNERLFLGTIAAGGTLGILIPPSINTILYGYLAEVSVPKLYLASFVPGFLLAGLFMLTTLVACLLRPAWGGHHARSSWHDRLASLPHLGPPLAIFIIVIGSIYTGLATPTESAALGAFATIVMALAYGAMSLKAMARALQGTVAISGMILFIILGATTFSQIRSFSGATEGLVSTILGQGLSRLAVVAVMMLILIFLGIFIDQVSMMLITLPVFMPIVARLGIDPIWFGILFLICMQLGLLLPPHGLLLMTMRGVAPPEVTMVHIFRAIVPYVIMSLLLLALLLLFPAVATWLPNRLVG